MKTYSIPIKQEEVKKQLFLLELQGYIKNTALHILDNAIEGSKAKKPVKVNINQYVIREGR